MLSYKPILIALGLVAVTGCGHRTIVCADSSADNGQSDANVLIIDSSTDEGVDYFYDDSTDTGPDLDLDSVPDQSPDKYVNKPPIVKFLYTMGGAPGQQTALYFSSKDPEGTTMKFNITSTPSLNSKWHMMGSAGYLIMRTDGALELSTLNNKLMVPVQFSFTATDADGKSTTVTVDRNLNRYNTGATLWCGTEQWNFALDMDLTQKMYSGLKGFVMSPGEYKATSTSDSKGLASVVAAWKNLTQDEKQRVADRSANYSTIISKMNAMTGGSGCYYTHIGIEDVTTK